MDRYFESYCRKRSKYNNRAFSNSFYFHALEVVFALSLIIRSAVAPVLLLLIPCKTRSLWREKSSKLQNYLQHTALVGGPNPSCCPICQKLCISGEELMEHMKYVHKDPNASGVPGKSRLYCHLLAFKDRGVAAISKVWGLGLRW